MEPKKVQPPLKVRKWDVICTVKTRNPSAEIDKKTIKPLLEGKFADDDTFNIVVHSVEPK